MSQRRTAALPATEGRPIISREDCIEQSVSDYARNQIFTVRGYPTSQVEMLESFPYTREADRLDKNLIALGFNFDDDGEPAELGSSLTSRLYTIQFWIFGKTNTYARNLANQLKFGLQVDACIPLMDISQVPPVQMDALIVDGVSAERQIIQDPAPWQEFVWTVHLKVQDLYFAAAA